MFTKTCAIVGRTAVRQNADHGELPFVFVPFGAAVGRRDLVPELHFHFAADMRADDRFEVPVLLAAMHEVATLSKLVLPLLLGFEDELVEKVGRGADNAKIAEVIAQANGNRQFNLRSELAVPVEILPACLHQLLSREGLLDCEIFEAGTSCQAGELSHFEQLVVATQSQ